MDRSTYVLSAALAASLGVNTMLAAGGISPVQAIEAPRQEMVRAPLDGEHLACIRAAVQALACPVVDQRYGLTGDAACDASRDWTQGASIALDTPEGPQLVVRLDVTGTWVPGSPQ